MQNIFLIEINYRLQFAENCLITFVVNEPTTARSEAQMLCTLASHEVLMEIRVMCAAISVAMRDSG